MLSYQRQPRVKVSKSKSVDRAVTVGNFIQHEVQGLCIYSQHSKMHFELLSKKDARCRLEKLVFAAKKAMHSVHSMRRTCARLYIHDISMQCQSFDILVMHINILNNVCELWAVDHDDDIAAAAE